MSTDLAEWLSRAERVGILHHWDADGISSAAMILARQEQNRARCINASPPIGDYTDFTIPIEALLKDKPDLVVGVDLALSQEVLSGMVEALGGVQAVWIDHHSHPPKPMDGITIFHPSLMPSQKSPPSNAWFLSILLGEPPELLAAVGSCGDLGYTLHSSDWCPHVEEAAARGGLSLSEAFTLTDLLDSNYRADSHDGVLDGPEILLEGLRSPQGLMCRADWLQTKLAVDAEVLRVLSEPSEIRGSTIIKIFESRMHLTSIIARRIALGPQPPLKAVIVANSARPQSAFYIRRLRASLDLTPLIELGRSMGYSAGGKPEVVGMMVPREDVEGMVETITHHLESPA